VHNFRFNESPVAMLNKVVALGPSMRAYGEESIGIPTAAPTLLVDGFTLSSVSDAV
jgi:predicted Zn-dependent protease